MVRRVSDEPRYLGTVAPERQWNLDSFGLRLNLIEWGDPQGEPVLLTHGMWDHARSFAGFAPWLAEHFRVVAVDARGHGDSEWADNYSWLVDVLDVVNVLRSFDRPVNLVGHSKGGGQASDAARLAPECVKRLVNIDGFGPPEMDDPRSPPLIMAEVLDRRRKLRASWRRYANIDELAERRGAQNPRLSLEWLRYFSFHGATCNEEGWTWKSDPLMGVGYGPWRPDWIAPSYAFIPMPMLAIVGSEEDTWGPLPPSLLDQRLSYIPNLERCTIAGAGHFVHIEQPRATADVVLDFLRQ